MAIQVVILAAGQGKRMHSSLPKVLHRLGDKPLLEHVITTALKLNTQRSPIIIYGHQGDVIRQHFNHYDVRWVAQKECLGTGHAVLQALPEINDPDDVLVLYGDVPLISLQTLNTLIHTTPKSTVGMLSACLENPSGYGRIKRDQHDRIIGIIEEKDANATEQTIAEINPGIYFLAAHYLKRWLPQLDNKNSQKEYYLTDIIAQAVKASIPIHAIQPTLKEEILGVNDHLQLARLERFFQQQIAERLLQQGVKLQDPHRFDVRGEIFVGRDVEIDINVILEGRVVIGDGCHIGPHVLLRNTVLCEGTEIKAFSLLDGVEVAAHCSIGPFARLRPGTILQKAVHIGNFVEVKNSLIDESTKINHLSYVGDSEIGKCVNIGAGTITCNYDGLNKHKTIIGDHTHIGSDTQLVAPVIVGEGATIGAGSTITKDVPPHQLTVTHRIEQRSIEGWKRPDKEI